MRIEDCLSDEEYRDFTRLKELTNIGQHMTNMRDAMRALPYGVVLTLVEEGLAARSEGNSYLVREGLRHGKGS